MTTVKVSVGAIASMCVVMAVALFVSAIHVGISRPSILIGVGAVAIEADMARRFFRSNRRPSDRNPVHTSTDLYTHAWDLRRHGRIVLVVAAAMAAVGFAMWVVPGTVEQPSAVIALTDVSARQPIVVGDRVQYTVTEGDGRTRNESVIATSCGGPLVVRESGRELRVPVRCKS